MKIDFVYALVKTILGSFLSFVLPLVILNYLSFQTYGVFVQKFLTVNFLAIFGGGLNLGLVKVIVADKTENINYEPLLEHYIWLFSLRSGVVLTLISASFIYAEVSIIFILLSIVFFGLLAVTQEALLKAHGRFKEYYTLNSLLLILRLVLVWFFISLRSDILSIGYGYLSSIFIYYLFLLYLNRRNYLSNVIFNRSKLRGILKAVIDHSTHSLIRMFSDFSIRYLLTVAPGIILGSPGLTSALDLAAKIPQGMYGIITSSYPVLLNKQIGDSLNTKGRKEWLNKANKIFSSVALFSFISVYFVSEYILTLWLGLEFQIETISFIKYFLIIYCIKAARDHGIQTIVAINRHKMLSVYLIIIVGFLAALLPISFVSIELYLMLACCVYIIRNFIIIKLLVK